MRVLRYFRDEYAIEHEIIIDTDTELPCPTVGEENVTAVIHTDLAHPFFLTWQHRKHFKERIEDYDWVFYCEDDLYLPFENFQAYTSSFEILWPHYVPALVRVEKFEGEEWALDITERQPCVPAITSFCALKQPYYQGCWIMPKWALKQTMTSDFARLSDSREAAASFPLWELNKIPVVEVEDGKVSRRCFAYHLPNNYAPCPTSPHGKIKVAEIFS